MIAAAKAANPEIRVTARVHSGEQRERLIQAGAEMVVNGDEVTAQAIADHLLQTASDVPGARGPLLADDPPILSEPDAAASFELTRRAEPLP